LSFRSDDEPRLSPAGFPVGRVCCGFDVGQSQDYSALCVQQPERRPDPFAEESGVWPSKSRQVTFFRVLHLERFPLGVSYQDQLDLVAARCLEVYERAGHEKPLLRVDASGNGRAPAETLANMSEAGDPFDVVRVNIVAGDNRAWYGPLGLSWARTRWWHGCSDCWASGGCWSRRGWPTCRSSSASSATTSAASALLASSSRARSRPAATTTW
jgi:hypothetical protein